MKDAYYFSHDANAFTDPKIMRLRASYGLEGYGFYFAILELMRNEANYQLDIEDEDFLMFHLSIDEAKLKQMLSKCLQIGLFRKDDHNLFSDSFLLRMAEVDKIREKRRSAGRKGGKAKPSLSKPQAKDKQKTSIKGKESKEEESKVKDIKEEDIIPKYDPLKAIANISEIDPKLWKEWIDHKKKIKLAVTERAINGNINKLKALGLENANTALEQSIDAGWKDVYLKDKPAQQQQDINPFDGIFN